MEKKDTNDKIVGVLVATSSANVISDMTNAITVGKTGYAFMINNQGVFVAHKDGQIFVHADLKGLAVLIRSLQSIQKKVEAGICEHDHLMTDAWAGNELSEKQGIEKGELIHHVKFFGWTEKWAKKHGFKKQKTTL